MRQRTWMTILLMFICCFSTPGAQQQSSQSAPPAKAQTQSASQAQTPPAGQMVDPLVEAARKAREEHKTATKPATVFTNDNIPTTPNAINVVGTASAASDENQQKAANASSAGGTGAQNDEASWRKRFADARAELQRDQDNLSVMKRELSVLQVQYYPDPSKTLMQSVTNSDIAKKHQNIDTMEKQVQADQQAISNLEDELRKAGGDPAWARE